MEAERQTIWFRDWVKLPDYATQKTDETGDADIARGLIVRELQREAEGRLPYRYKRADDIDRRWHYEGLPIGYQWDDATIDWLRATARWVKRIRPGLPALGELEIYRIQVNPPLPRESEPEEIFPSLFKPGESLEPEPAVDKAPPVETEAAESERRIAPRSRNRERIWNIIVALDQQRPCPFTADMRPHDIERIVKHPYNALWLPGDKFDADGKYLGPSRDTFWRAYQNYREANPLK